MSDEPTLRDVEELRDALADGLPLTPQQEAWRDRLLVDIERSLDELLAEVTPPGFAAWQEALVAEARRDFDALMQTLDASRVRRGDREA